MINEITDRGNKFSDQTNASKTTVVCYKKHCHIKYSVDELLLNLIKSSLILVYIMLI